MMINKDKYKFLQLLLKWHDYYIAINKVDYCHDEMVCSVIDLRSAAVLFKAGKNDDAWVQHSHDDG